MFLMVTFAASVLALVGRESRAADSASVSTGTVVDHARVLASDRQGCYLVASAEDECRPWSRSGWLPSPVALLDLGVWVGPWQQDLVGGCRAGFQCRME